jgi:hypothetical protein
MQSIGPTDLKLSNWKDLFELLALVAVIGGLVAVVIELRQTQSALRAQAYQSRALDVMNGMRHSSTNPERAILIRNFYQGDLTIESLSSE